MLKEVETSHFHRNVVDIKLSKPNYCGRTVDFNPVIVFSEHALVVYVCVPKSDNVSTETCLNLLFDCFVHLFFCQTCFGK